MHSLQCSRLKNKSHSEFGGLIKPDFVERDLAHRARWQVESFVPRFGAAGVAQIHRQHTVFARFQGAGLTAGK